MKNFIGWKCYRHKKVYLALVFLCLGLSAWGVSIALAEMHKSPIEIVVNGRKFESIEQYQKSKRELKTKGKKIFDRLAVSREAFLTPLFYFISCGHDFRWFDRLQGVVNIEQSNKNIEKKDLALSRYERFLPAFAAMSKVGFNTGVIRMIEAFQNTGNNTISYKSISRNDLERALSKSFPEGGYSGPILLISDKNKVRILTLDSK